MGRRHKDILMRVSRSPELFIFCLMKRIEKSAPGLVDQGFFEQIIKKYRRTSAFFRLSLYFLKFPGTFGYHSTKMSLSCNFLIFLKNLTPLKLFRIISEAPRLQGGASKRIINLGDKSPNPPHKGARVSLAQQGVFRLDFHKRNIEEKETRVSENRLSYFVSISNSDQISAIANLFHQTGIYNDFFKSRTIIVPPETRFRLMEGLSGQGRTPAIPFIEQTITGPWLTKENENPPKSPAKISRSSGKHLSHYISTSRAHYIPVNLYNIIKEKQQDISKEKIPWPISLLPSVKTHGLMKTLHTLSVPFLKSPVIYEKPAREEKDTPLYTEKRKRNLVEELMTTTFNTVKGLYLNKKSINNMIYTNFLDHNLTHIKQIHMLGKSRINENFKSTMMSLLQKSKRANYLSFPRKWESSISNGLYDTLDSRFHGNDDFCKSLMIKEKNEKSLHYEKSEDNKNIVQKLKQPLFGAEAKYSVPGGSVLRHRHNFPDMIYFSPGKSPTSSDIDQKAEKRGIKKSLDIKTEIAGPLSIPETNIYGLAERVYGLIVEKVRREREMRGR